MIKLSAAALETFVSSIFHAAGCSAEEGERVARHLVAAKAEEALVAVEKSDVAGAEDPRVARQDLLDQGCPRARQPEDEHRANVLRPSSGHLLE